MSKIKFKDLAVDAIFTYSGKQYKKIKEKRISCCKFFNAQLVSDPKKQIGIKPLIEVDIENNEQK
jgi:hypothetical protein